MEKIKSVISSHRKSTDAPNERVPPASIQHREGNASSDIPHPIYDEFTSSNRQGQSEQSQSLGTSLLRPDAAKGHESVQSEAVSNASVKSGVVGYPPQAHSSHAGDVRGAQRNLGDDSTSSLGNDYHSSTGEGISGDRAFPLAGGVAHTRPAESATINERQPGTKDKASGVHDGEEKEALAGAATAATSSHGRSQAHNSKGTRTERYHPDALAAAVAAVTNTQSPATHVPHDSKQEPRERRLHIPGEYPSPTPVDQSSAPSYFESKNTSRSDPRNQHELRQTGSLEHSQMGSGNDHDKPANHHGRDAAVTGGLGAAGAATAAASKHNHDGAAQPSDETIPSEPSPYSSKKMDPRVDMMPVASYDHQNFDPTTSTKHHGGDAVLTGGGSSHGTPNQPISQYHEDRPQQQKHGRDAAFVGAGAGAVTTAGLYAHQRANEPDSGPASSTIGPHQSNISNVLDPRVQPDPSLQKHHHAAPTVDDPAPSTVGPHKSDVANILDPRVLPDPQKQKAQPKKTANGDNTAITSDAAQDAARLYDTHRATQPAASMEDQRYDPLAPGAHNPFQGAPTPHALEQKNHHHSGRDAAIVAGLGAAGASTYAASHGHDSNQQSAVAQHQLAHPQMIQQDVQGQLQHASQGHQQPHDTRRNYGPDAAPAGGVGALGIGAYAGRGNHENITFQNHGPKELNQHSYPVQLQHVSNEATQQPQHHYGRDAAVLGGLGAAGTGVYAATRDNQHTPYQGSLQQRPTQPGFQPSNASSNQQHQRYDSVQDPTMQDDHQKRHAAAAGTAGALAGAGGAYAYSQHDAEKERKAAEKAHEKLLKDQQREFDKEQKKAQKAQEKALHDKQKELEHQHAKEQKHHNKLVAAEEKKHHKELEKEKHEQPGEYEEVLPEDEGEKKKHHLLGFLHRDKDKRRSVDEKDTRQSVESPRHSREHANTGHRASGSLHSSDGEKKNRNKLHKEPPPGHPAHEAMEHQQHQDHEKSPVTGKRHFFGSKRMSGSDHHAGADRPISSGMYSADDASWHHESAIEPLAQQPAN